VIESVGTWVRGIEELGPTQTTLFSTIQHIFCCLKLNLFSHGQWLIVKVENPYSKKNKRPCYLFCFKVLTTGHIRVNSKVGFWASGCEYWPKTTKESGTKSPKV